MDHAHTKKHTHTFTAHITSSCMVYMFVDAGTHMVFRVNPVLLKDIHHSS